jgi:flagellar hook-length control protein FliK
MTPTTSSSSILLLGGAGDGVKAAAAPTAAGAEPSGDAALGGFQLLLAELSQQLQLPGVPAAASTAAAATDGGDGAATDQGDGNALPFSGLILPFAALQNGAATETPVDGDAPKKQGADDDSAQTADVLPLFAALQVQAPPPAQPAAENSAAATAAVAADAAAAAPVDLTTLTDSALAAPVAPKADKAGRAQQPAGLSLGLPVAGADDAAAAATLELPAVAAPATDAAETDFDALLKHFDAAPTPVATAAPVADTGRAQPLPRAYADAAANATANVPVPVGNNGWSDAVADKVMWFSANKISTAEIHLNPPDLGPLQVRINAQHDQASVVFSSQHAQVRDALDQALPRLRDMLGSQGIQLLDVSVGGQGAERQPQFSRNDGGQQQRQSGGDDFGFDGGIDAAAPVTVTNLRVPRSAVDAYA